MHEIRRLREVIAYENRFIRLYDDSVEFPGGRQGNYVRLETLPAGTPVVLLAHWEGRIGLVQTYRYPIGRPEWSLPRGFAHGSSIEASAAEELREELGATASDLRVLGHVTPDSGLLSTRAAVVIARVVEVSDSHDDFEEVAAKRWVTPVELTSMIRSGEIEDAFTLSAWMLSSVHDVVF